jgi:hypothetical protein
MREDLGFFLQSEAGVDDFLSFTCIAALTPNKIYSRSFQGLAL